MEAMKGRGAIRNSKTDAQQHPQLQASKSLVEMYLNFQVVIVSSVVALPQILLVKDDTVHWLPWALHIAASHKI